MTWTPAHKRRLALRMKQVWARRKASAGSAGSTAGPSRSTPKRAGSGFKCETCGRVFTMAAHLGRHRTTMHGARPVKPIMRPKHIARYRSPMATTPMNDLKKNATDVLIKLRRQIDHELADRLVRGMA